MNDYFSRFEESMGDALQSGANVPWYSRRLTRIRHGRTVALLFGALVIGTPAGAVSNCFGACAPTRLTPPAVSAAQGPSSRPRTELAVLADVVGRRRKRPESRAIPAVRDWGER
jgi:hypothetical protein